MKILLLNRKHTNFKKLHSSLQLSSNHHYLHPRHHPLHIKIESKIRLKNILHNTVALQYKRFYLHEKHAHALLDSLISDNLLPNGFDLKQQNAPFKCRLLNEYFMKSSRFFNSVFLKLIWFANRRSSTTGVCLSERKFWLPWVNETAK